MGDIHQPLHVGYAHDKGGNDIKVEFFLNRTDLHTVWDSLLIRHTKKRVEGLRRGTVQGDHAREGCTVEEVNRSVRMGDRIASARG